ncbi:MAG: sulfatase-like hydrolase/transferase [Marinilabiliaceae bacterium]|nr:sulfatase-like hydrolase/transferase [Marinilabiliaceae bacterium]
MNVIKCLRKLGVIVTMGLTVACQPTAPQDKVQKPNIIVIMDDDLGYAGLSCFGGEGIATPELDKLAKNGVRCTNFYANRTVCSPTRVALLSGRYQQRVGLDHIYYHCVDSIGFDPRTNPSMPVILKEAGYKTGVFGKWHLGSGPDYQPRVHGFDDFVGFLDGNIDFISKHNTESEVDWYVHHEYSNQDGYVTHLLNDAVVNFIEREHEEPFFIYMPEAAVHVPMQAPGDDPLRTDEFYTYKVDDKFPQKEYMRRYAGMITAMDEGVGRIMETLRKYDLEENTLIIFTSDNGGEPAGVKNGNVNGVYRGHKTTLYEGGIRVPAIFYWKGELQSGVVNEDVMLTMDILPTILDVAGIEFIGNKVLDGTSLYGSLFDQKALPDRDLYWMHTERLVMRRSDMKLIRQNKGVELYNLANDPREEINLALDDSYSELVETMVASSNQWRDSVAIGQPAEREIGTWVKPVWPCTRDLKTFNKGKTFKWKDGAALIE